MVHRVVVLRGDLLRPSDLAPWQLIGAPFQVSVPVIAGGGDPLHGLDLGRHDVRTVRSTLPPGLVGDLATRVVGNRYLDLEPVLAGAEVVHAAELGFWFTWQAARLRARLGYKLVVTVWETLPFRDAYRNVRTRRYRRRVLEAADLFVAVTERARSALLLEGVAAQRIVVVGPGIDLAKFEPAREHDPSDGRHVVLSIGRLVWEKGHQDVIRALAKLRGEGCHDVKLVIAGTGPQERRLRAVAADFGLGDAVEFAGHVDYVQLPALFARASCLVLASLPTWCWEEQFGMVLVEAMAAHVPVIASSSGAIPEVVGEDAELFAPGDWVGLARCLRDGPLAAAPGARHAPGPQRLEGFSSAAAAAGLRAAYERVLAP